MKRKQLQNFMVDVYLSKHAKTFNEENYQFYQQFDKLLTVELKLYILKFYLLEINPLNFPTFFEQVKYNEDDKNHSTNNEEEDNQLYKTILTNEEKNIMERNVMKQLFGKFENQPNRIFQLYYHFKIDYCFNTAKIRFKFRTIFDELLMKLFFKDCLSIYCETFYFLPGMIGNLKDTKCFVKNVQINQFIHLLKTYCMDIEQIKVKLDYSVLSVLNSEICSKLKRCMIFISPDHSLLKGEYFNFVTEVECICFKEEDESNNSKNLTIQNLCDILQYFPNCNDLNLRKVFLNDENLNESNFSLKPLFDLLISREEKELLLTKPIANKVNNISSVLRSLKIDLSFSNVESILFFWKELSNFKLLESLSIRLSGVDNNKKQLEVVKQCFGRNTCLSFLKSLTIEQEHDYLNNDIYYFDQSLLYSILEFRYQSLLELSIDFNVHNILELEKAIKFLKYDDCTIRKLQLSNISINSTICKYLGKSSSLKWLILYNVIFIPDENDNTILTCISNLSNSTSITHLELPCCYLNDENLEPLFSNMSQLELLNLRYNNISPDLLFQFISTVNTNNNNNNHNNDMGDSEDENSNNNGNMNPLFALMYNGGDSSDEEDNSNDNTTTPGQQRNDNNRHLKHLTALNISGNPLITSEHADSLSENESLRYLYAHTIDTSPTQMWK
ncbi:hypothetical protein ABK040_005466 [Willaertia magna]